MRSKTVTARRRPAVPMTRTLPLLSAFAVVFAGVTSPAWGARPVPAAKYRSGDLASNIEVVLKVAKTGRRLTPVNESVFSSKCTNGRGPYLAAYYGDLIAKPARLPIAPDGTFAGTFQEPESFLDVFVASQTFSLSGKFIRAGNAVRVRVRAVTVGEGGTVCDSGEHSRTAKRVRRRA